MMIDFLAKNISKISIIFNPKNSVALFMTRLSSKLAGQGVRRRPGLGQRLGGTWIHRDPEAGDPAP